MQDFYEVKRFDNRTEYYKDGKIHRDNNLPAIEYASGTKQWYQNGLLHRVDGPAVECANGNKYWYIEGKEYSEEEFTQNVLSFGKNEIVDELKYEVSKKFDNRTEYYFNSKLHRDDDLPAIEYTNGEKRWYKNGERHRLNGPAVEYTDGRKTWCQNGQLHRLDGPAYEDINGFQYWYIFGKEYTKEEFDKILSIIM